MAKRLFDIFSSIMVLLIGLPFFIIIAVLISLESSGGPFFIQTRVGKHGKHFGLIKFRSMRKNTESKGQLTIGEDPRITRTGKFIRRFKIDEFPQLINVLKGEMSVVGPRPEVPKYVEMYSEEQRGVLQVKPGLTDYASLEYIDEDCLLGESDNPEETYVNEIIPAKLKLNKKYIEEAGLSTDIKIIFRTIGKLF